MRIKLYRNIGLALGGFIVISLAYLAGVEAAGLGVRQMSNGLRTMMNAEPSAVHDVTGKWGRGYDDFVWGRSQARCPIWWQITHHGLVPSSVAYPVFKLAGCARE